MRVLPNSCMSILGCAPRMSSSIWWKIRAKIGPLATVRRNISSCPKKNGSSLSAHLRFQPCLHRRPLRVNDAVHHRIALIAALQDHLLAQDTLAHRAQPFDGALRAFVAAVRLELHANRAQRLEGMPQQQILTYGIHGSAPDGTHQPCPADLQAIVRWH